MALTFSEKRLYQKQAAASRKTLKKGGLAFMEKRAAQKQWKEALAKLRGAKAEKSLYERLVAGEFNNLPWQQYYEKLKEAWTESGADLASAPMEAIKYLEAHYDPASDSMDQAA